MHNILTNIIGVVLNTFEFMNVQGKCLTSVFDKEQG